MYVDDIKLDGKKQNLDPMWKVLNKEVDFGEPTSFLDHVFLGVLNDSLKSAKILFTITDSCSNPEFQQGLRKKLRARKNWVFLRGPTIWKVMSRSVWNVFVNWQTRLLNNFIRYQLHALMTINSKKKDWNPWEKLSMYALKFSWNLYIWHALVDVIFYGQSTNIHDRSQKWVRACDKRLSRLISCIHFTSEFK